MIEFKQTKRTKGKHTCDSTLRDFYKDYVQRAKNKNRPYVTYKLYSTIIKDFNIRARHKIITEARSLRLPYKLGSLGIIKYDVNFNLENKNIWKVDYKKSKDLGMIVYYDQPFRYKWRWDKSGVSIIGKRYRTFKPCREAARMVAKHVKENPKFDYYSKLSKV